MGRRAGLALMACVAASGSVMLDRIAAVVEKQPIKDSDIERDIRITALLNGERPEISPDARKKAVSRLIDQALIRREMEVSGFSDAKPEETDRMLEQVRARLGSEAAYRSALDRYGVTDARVRRQVDQQVNLLHFVERRFRPGVLVTEEDIKKYFDRRQAELRQKAGGKAVSLDDVHDAIEQQIAEERVNEQFFAWLDEARKNARIQYLEPELK